MPSPTMPHFDRKLITTFSTSLLTYHTDVIRAFYSLTIKGLTKGANLRDSWHSKVITLFFKEFKKHGITIKRKRGSGNLGSTPLLLNKMLSQDSPTLTF